MPAAPADSLLLLVRHGQIEANVLRRWHGSTDSPLTDAGRAQVRLLTDYIARVHPDTTAVYTSPLQRARDTGQPIATALAIPLFVDPDLAEYGLGVLENELYGDLVGSLGFFTRTASDLTWAPQGGESLGAVADRIVGAWRRIAAARPGQAIVVVSHGAAGAAGLASLLENDPRQWTRYHQRNASITELALGSTARLIAFDRVEHLA